MTEGRKVVEADLKSIDDELSQPSQSSQRDAVCASHKDLIAARNLREAASATEHLARRVIGKIGLQHVADCANLVRREIWCGAMCTLRTRSAYS
jgi:precorrin-6x reductase